MSETARISEIVIRPFETDDRAAWEPLWRGYQQFYGVDIPAEVTDLTWGRFLEPEEPMGGALAWRGGEAVGLVHHVRHRSTWTAGDYLYLQDLFAAPAARGTGVGRRLIEHVYGLAEGWAIPRVYWLTHETNAQAMTLYDAVAERSGFVQYRRQFKR